MGLGFHGGGVASAQWFFQHGARVVVTDLKNETALRNSIIALNKGTRAYRLANPQASLTSISYALGQHREEDFRSADLIIQNPGVPRESPYMKYALDAGVPIENEVTLFFLLTPKTPKIAVTGTRGKSTTTALIYEMLSRKDSGAVLLGVAGYGVSRPFLSVLDNVRQKENTDTPMPCVMELSSWQIELFGAHRTRPNIVVITNVLEDHLNRYPNFEAYRDTKTAIYAFQGTEDAVVLNYDNEHTRFFGLRGVPSRLYWFSLDSKNIIQGCALDNDTVVWIEQGNVSKLITLPSKRSMGKHTIKNILAACTAGKIAGCTPSQMSDAILNFSGVPSRLERIGQKDGRVWYDDTTATSPDATLAALQTLGSSGTKNIILIAGGADKNCDFTELARAIARYCRATVLFAGTATPKLASAMGSQGYEGKIEFANSMREAVSRAWSLSKKDDILLLSPAAASFGMFVNEFDRGAQFREAFFSLATNE